MRQEPITIPGFDLGAFARREARDFARHGYKDSVENESPPVLAGRATAYHRPFAHRGKIKMLTPGVFANTIAARSPVRFQLDHENSIVAADTKGALELFDADDGLYFRLPLDRVRNGAVLGQMAEGGDRSDISVGYRVLEEHTERYGRHEVTVIDRADLVELSLVRRGAVSQAFAFLSSASANPSVRDIHKSDVFVLAQIIDKLAKARRRVNGDNADLSARLDRLEAKVANDPEARAWTLARNCQWSA